MSFPLLLSPQQGGIYTRCTVPFLACGDLSGWDADRSYSLDLPDMQQQQQDSEGQQVTVAAAAAESAGGGRGDYVSLEPVQKPMHPAYQTALEQRRSQGKGS